MNVSYSYWLFNRYLKEGDVNASCLMSVSISLSQVLEILQAKVGNFA